MTGRKIITEALSIENKINQVKLSDLEVINI